MLSAQCRQLYRTAPHLRLLSSRRLLSSVPSDTGAQPTTPPHHEPESEENLALFDKLSSERWSGKIRLFTHVVSVGTCAIKRLLTDKMTQLVSVAIGIYAVGFMDYSPFLGDREHVFTPVT